jgi:hypothetical protein
MEGAMSNVLVIFQADTERTEQMALAVGVGAVEAEGSIRLRRLAGPDAVEVSHKGYGKLQAADLLWAKIIVVGLESGTPRAEEVDGLLSVLGSVDEGELDGKRAWTFNPEGLVVERSEAQVFVESALRVAGLVVISSNSLPNGGGDDVIDQMKRAGRFLASTPSDTGI